eukprot:TRINITY_DN1345_c0_g1_i2.p1 TRINITY_DN1345_c0_g1~~TRINITY_DN1345_c0_g1_i2.p1  ORF type:complete len:360 (+),score=72.10 TRINITY_DN1345_c0_g1_i2:359-1438(+)
MGNCGSKTEEDRRDAEIDRMIKASRSKLMSEVKLLLLGTGESGKSTVAKQMKILHMNGFTPEELASFKTILHGNALSSIKTLLREAQGRGLQLPPDLVSIGNEFYNGTDGGANNGLNGMEEVLGPESAVKIRRLWNTPAVQEAFEHRAEFQLPGSVEYVMTNIERLCDPKTILTHDDVLNTRLATTGIHEIQFELEGTTFRVMDVGGQRSERKKWIHCFEGVTAIIFCVAMNEYDEKLFEDEKVNRMKESLHLFKDICNNQYFNRSNMILFLNKSDLFRTKIQKVDLKKCFPDYTGGFDYEKGCVFIRDQFQQLNEVPGKIIYHHVTCATNTENIRVVFDAVRSTILNNNLEDAGLTSI